MNKSEITKNLKQIKQLLEEDAPMIAKERIGFLINDITKERQYRGQQGKSDTQVANNHKILFWSVIGMVVTFIVSLFFSWV